MLIDVINNDTISFNHRYYNSIRNYVMNLIVVLSNTSCIKTSLNIEKAGAGPNLNEY